MSKPKINIRLLIVFLLAVNFLFASNQIDSLEQALSETNSLEKKLGIYTHLIKQYQLTDLQQARSLTDKALALSLSTNNSNFLGEIYGLKGDIAVMQDSLEAAKKYYLVSLNYFRESDDINSMAGVNMVLGNIALTRDDLPTAMQYYLSTIAHSKKAGLETWLPGAYINIGSIYLKTGQFNKAQEYFTHAIDMSTQSGAEMITADAYSNMGATYLKFGDLETASDYFNKALAIYEQQQAIIGIAKTKQDLALVSNIEGKYELAIEQLEEAATLLKEGDPSYAGPRQPFWSANFIGLGINQMQIGKLTEASVNLQQGFLLSKNTGQLNLSSDATEYLSKLWEKKGNADSTLKYFRLYKAYSDSLNNEDNIRKLAFQEAEFSHAQELLLEKQKREKESEISQRNIIILLIAIVVLILALIALSLFLKLSRNKTKQAELEQKALKAELELRNKELTTHLVYQVKNNEFILNISKQLKAFLSKTSTENRPMVNDLIKQIEFDSASDQWEEFEIRFQQVHTDFYKNLAINYPDLSSNELRLCAFLKLNMNTKDIAAITYQSTNSITVARWRLRQKFGLAKEDSLTAFLTQF